MMIVSDRMRLFAFDFMAPTHLSAGLWRHGDDRGHRYQDLSFWTEYAEMLEAGCLDGVFFADHAGYHDVYEGEAVGALADAAQIPLIDPFLIVPAMASVTRHLGFGITGSTSYDHPYAMARRFASLDHLTGGRVGWNLVTSYSDSAARNLGTGHQTPHDERYAMAAEYLEVCHKLWEDSWDDDAVVRDARTRHLRRRHPRPRHRPPRPVLHRARVGPQWEPSPQRSPVIFQAGGSSKGRALAAASAEGVFVNAVSKAALKRQVDGPPGTRARVRPRPPETSRCSRCSTSSSPRPTSRPTRSTTPTAAWSATPGRMARYSGWRRPGHVPVRPRRATRATSRRTTARQ